jgi:hypothetical protein
MSWMRKLKNSCAIFIWTHIAGDAVQRMKVARRLMR